MEVKEKEVHLKDYLRVVMKRKKMILLFFFITVVTVVLGTIGTTPLYKASVKLKVEKNDANPLSANYGYSRYDPEFLQTQTEIIRSKAVAEKVVAFLDLENTYGSFFPEMENPPFSLSAFVKGQIRMVKGWLVSSEEEPGAARNLRALYFGEEVSPASVIAEALRKNIRVAPVKMSRVIDVSYASEHSVFAALVVNSIARAYIERVLEMRMENIGYTLDWMKKKAEEERGRLEKSERRLQEYLKDNNIITIEDRIAIIPQRINQLSAELTSLESERKRLATVLDMIAATPADMLESIPVVAANPRFQEVKANLFSKEQEILEASQQYGPRHPVMMRLEKEIAALKANRDQEVRMILQKLRNEYQLTLANEKNLEEQFKRTTSEAMRLNEAFGQYKILQREVETNSQLYQALVARIKEQTITEQIRDVDVWVIENAEVPEHPFNRGLKKNFLLALVLGAFGGIGLAFFLEYLDNRISLAEDAEEKTGLPVFGSVGMLTGDEMARQKVLIEAPHSVEAEAYKAIRASLLLATSKGLPASIMITSYTSGEGKTLTASNLALAIALSGKRVLLVDADMRKPKLHKVFNLSNEKGFSGILAGEDCKKGFILNAGVENLYVIPSGKKPVNPSELISSDLVKDMVAAFEKNFDVVIFDAPPVGLVSDPIVLGQRVESILLVTRSEVTKYDDVKTCIRKLGGLETRILGQIVNAVDLKKQGYSKSYYYSEYYK